MKSNPSTSCYENYRNKLQLISQENWRRKIITIFSEHWSEWDASKLWNSCYGRFDPESEPYATLLFQQPDYSQHMCLLEIFKQKPELFCDSLLYYDNELGWLHPRRFPDDSKLKHLSTVLDLNQTIEILRYRPNKRCTFSLQTDHNFRKIFGKQFADNRGAQIYAESQRLWNAAREGRFNFLIANHIRWDIKTQTLWQHAIEGKPLVKQLFSTKGITLAKRIGQAAASMTKSKLQPALHFDGQAQMRRSKKYAQELAKRMPDLSDSLNDLLESLALQHAQQSKEAKLKPLHGAPHAHQWLDCGDTLGLVDFDRTCLGEPELDATTFIAEMDFEDRQTVPVDELNHAFLEAYQQTAGKLDTDLLKAYRSHKRLAKALKAARSLRVNGDTKARKHLNFAHRALV